MESTTKRFTCTACPIGCALCVSLSGGKIDKVEGNLCPRGENWAKTEIEKPMRLFTTTVRVKGGRLPVCPVRTREAVPKKRLFEIARCVAQLEVEAPIRLGQVLLENVCGTGVPLVSCRDLPSQDSQCIHHLGLDGSKKAE